MKRANWVHAVTAASLLGAAFSVALGDEAAGAGGQVVQAVTSPSFKSSPSFAETGILKQVCVKLGDTVKAGELLAREDTDLEQIRASAMKIEADSTAEIKGDEADRDSKKLIFERKKQGIADQSVSAEEAEEARLDYVEAEIKIQYAQEQHEEKQAEYAMELQKIAKMSLLSPVDGRIEQVTQQVGDVIDPSKPEPFVTIVQNKPLWIDMHLPSIQASKLQKDQILAVAYASEPDKWMEAKVLAFNPEVDPTSDTQEVRLELKNAEDRPSGLEVMVKLPGDTAPTADADAKNFPK